VVNWPESFKLAGTTLQSTQKTQAQAACDHSYYHLARILEKLELSFAAILIQTLCISVSANLTASAPFLPIFDHALVQSGWSGASETGAEVAPSAGVNRSQSAW
jgi:hypothetical protein